MGRGNLGAIFPVYLIAIIFRGVMACSDINPCNAAKLTDCIGKFRGWAQAFKYIRLNAIGCKAEGCFVCKFRGHPPGIIGNRHALCLSIYRCDIVSQALGCLTHCIDIHTVRSCTDYAPEPGRAKFQIHVETFFYLFFIIGDSPQLCFGCFIKIWVLQPVFVNLPVIHFLPP